MPKSFYMSHTRDCLATGKVQFKNEEEAIIALGKIARESGEKMEHYLCKKCKFYHLSRMKRRRRKKHEVGGTRTESS